MTDQDFEICPRGTRSTLQRLFYMVDEMISMSLLQEKQYRENSAQRARILLQEIRNGDVYSIVTGRTVPPRHAERRYRHDRIHGNRSE